MKKRVLFLGAAPGQISPIRYSKAQGYYVITADNVPSNPGHQMADECHNVSTTDVDQILRLAANLKIDAVVAYASDPAALTAAIVADQMGLVGNPPEAVEILTHKDLFRGFLAKNGFNVPRSRTFTTLEEAQLWIRQGTANYFVKPVDSSGSKGVTRIIAEDQLDPAFSHAMAFSRAKRVIIEEEILKDGFQIAGDGFLREGNLEFRCWADEHFDQLCNGIVPIGQTFPSTQAEHRLELAHHESQRLLALLGMRTGALNFDFVFDGQGELFFLEIGPRNGGCLIPDVIKYATGVDLAARTVEAALGSQLQVIGRPVVEGFWSSYVVHALSSGVFRGLSVSERAKACVVESDLYVKEGDKVKKFLGSNDSIGMMILRYRSHSEMLEMIENMERDLLALVE